MKDKLEDLREQLWVAIRFYAFAYNEWHRNGGDTAAAAHDKAKAKVDHIVDQIAAIDNSN